MKKYPYGLTLRAVCAAIEDYQRHEDSLPEEGILAAFNTLLGHSDIADELRIKQNHIRLRDTYIEELEQRAEAAEEKLAEYEKQEPAGKFAFEPLAERYHHIKYGEAQHMEPKLPLVKLFIRPAPAVSLAELVPDEMHPDHPKMRWVGMDELFPKIEGWNDCRAAILRNIEEAK